MTIKRIVIGRVGSTYFLIKDLRFNASTPDFSEHCAGTTKEHIIVTKEMNSGKRFGGQKAQDWTVAGSDSFPSKRIMTADERKKHTFTAEFVPGF